MLGDVPSCRRSAAALGAGLVAGAILTGCAHSETGTATAAATGPAETSAAPASESDSDLAAGLLPAEAFGEGAEVVQLPLDDMPAFDHWDDGWNHWNPWWQDDEEDVTPPECLAALEEAAEESGGVQDAAGQFARTDGVRTVEVLAVPDAPVNAVEQFQAVVGACGSASFSEQHGHAGMTGQVSVEELPGLPEGMAGVSVTFSGDFPGGSWSATALAGVAQDGDRVLALVQTSDHRHGLDFHDLDSPDMDSPDLDATDGDALDPEAFTALLQQAYDVQADALD
jgi:hypothetical protein